MLSFLTFNILHVRISKFYNFFFQSELFKILQFYNFLFDVMFSKFYNTFFNVKIVNFTIFFM